MYEAYPLQWPAGYKRTAADQRKQSQFKQSMNAAQKFLHSQIELLKATDLVVSTNIPIRSDGMLYADWMRRKIDDPGVAIYFKLKGKHISMCADKFERIWENVYALGKGIEALRGMDRWGVSDFLDRAFTGFAALPETTISEADIWRTLGLESKPDSTIIIHQAYKQQAKKVHPDMGGSSDGFNKLKNAYNAALGFFNTSNP